MCHKVRGKREKVVAVVKGRKPKNPSFHKPGKRFAESRLEQLWKKRTYMDSPMRRDRKQKEGNKNDPWYETGDETLGQKKKKNKTPPERAAGGTIKGGRGYLLMTTDNEFACLKNLYSDKVGRGDYSAGKAGKIKKRITGFGGSQRTVVSTGTKKRDSRMGTESSNNKVRGGS